MTEIFVKKWDKSKEPYDRNKLAQSLERYGLTQEQTSHIIPKVENQIYDGITTKKLRQIMLNEIKGSKFDFKRNDLRTALGLMRSKPDFEVYVQELLRGLGYDVTPNRVIQGHCVTHEIDGVAEKDGKQYYIETKHHSKPHIRIPFIDTLAAQAKLEDIRKGYEEGRNNYEFDKIIIICNTKMTSHAEQYSRCVGIQHIGWNSPRNHGIERHIEDTGIYPFTVLPTLAPKERKTLSSMGVTTIQDVLKLETSKLDKSRLKELKEEADRLLG